MADWWNALLPLQQVFYCMAIPASVVMILQTVLLLFGIGDNGPDADIDADFDGDAHLDAHHSGLSLFTVRGIVAFFAIGGWTGIAMYELTVNGIVSILCSVIFGIAALIFVAYTLKLAMKLEDNGNIKIENAVGKNAEVYLTIPGGMSGKGKIQVTVQERLCELSAVTRSQTPLKTGAFCTVVASIDDETLLVDPVNN